MELVQLAGGSFYLARRESLRGMRECIYRDARATIRRTDAPHQYQLVVSPTPQDGDGEVTSADALDDEHAFLIDTQLQFRAASVRDAPAFVWMDPSEQDTLLEFIVDAQRVNSVTRSVFEVTFLQCAWERMTGRSHDEASDEDLERVRWQPVDEHAPAEQGNAPAPPHVEGESAHAPPAPAPAPAPAQTSTRTPTTPTDTLQSITGTDTPHIVLTATADLYLYDQNSGLFMRQERGVTAQIAEAGRFLYWMVVQGADAPWLSQGLDSKMNMNFSHENLSAVWNYYDERGVFSWLLRFADVPSYEAFQEGFSHLIWETLNEESWSKAAAGDRAYLEQAYEHDVAMTAEDGNTSAHTLLSPRPSGAHTDDDNDDEDGDNDDVLDPMDEDEDESDVADSEDEAAAELGATSTMADGTREVNSQLAVGYKFDRAFVVRGDKIGVFRHTDDDGLEFAAAINKVSTPQGNALVPSKIMLHDQDASMVLMDPANRHSLYRMDLEYGKVVDEWRVHDDVPVSNIVPTTKFAQMTAEKTLVGTSRNGVFRIDPRLPGEKLVDSQFKLYAGKNDFSAATTDERGRLAVASNKGDLRLFDQIGKNAKTALPAIGDPIIGVDVSADGRWIVATCRTYLLLIDTLIPEGRFAGQLGFDRSFPANAKPLPRRLQLRPHHVAYMDSEVCFTPAHFNVGTDAETSIVTSTGNYVVSWQFEAVKKGNPHAYVLKRFDGVVVRDEHTYGSDQSIVVAFENDVQLAQRAQLRKPTRASLAPAPTERSAGARRRATHV